MKRTKKPVKQPNQPDLPEQPKPPMGGFMPRPPEHCPASKKVKSGNGILCVDLAICVRTCDPNYCKQRNEYMKKCKKERQREKETNEHS